MKNRDKNLKIENYVIAMIFLIMNQHPTLQPYHTTPPYLLNLPSTNKFDISVNFYYFWLLLERDYLSSH